MYSFFDFCKTVAHSISSNLPNKSSTKLSTKFLTIFQQFHDLRACIFATKCVLQCLISGFSMPVPFLLIYSAFKSYFMLLCSFYDFMIFVHVLCANFFFVSFELKNQTAKKSKLLFNFCSKCERY